MAKRIDPDNLDLIGGRAAAKKLTLYARQSGPASIPLLERAIAAGSVDVREAAVAALARFDRARAEEIVVAVIDGLPKKPQKKELAALVRCLLVAGAIDRALDRMLGRTRVALSLDRLDQAVVASVVERVLARLPALDETAHADLFDALDLDMVIAELPAELRRRACLAFIDDPRTPERPRAYFVDLLIQQGDAASLASVVDRARASKLPFGAGARAILAGDSRQAYDELAPVFRSEPNTRAAIMDALDAHADPRWAQDVLALVEEDPPGVTKVLAILRAGDELVDLAVRPTLDEVARCALHALGRIGDPRATELLLSWLDSPEGESRAPMLLTALGDCGDARAIPVLERKLAGAGARAAFYHHAIASIRGRVAGV